MSKAVLDSPYSWARLAITLLIASIASVGIWTYIGIMPAVQAEFGVDRGAASFAYTVTMFGFAFGNLLMGRLIDRFSAMTALMIGAVMLSAGFALSAYAPSMAAVSALHFIIGLGSATSFGPLMADISHWFLRRRGLAVTVTASGNYLAGAFWPWALSDVLADHGWRAVYLIMAVIVFGAVIPLSLFLRRRPPADVMAEAQAKASAAAMTAGMSARTIQWLLSLAGLACCVAMSMPQVHIVAYCVDLGYGPAVGAEMLSLMLLGGVASRILSGMLADRIGGVKTVLVGSILQMTALLLYLPSDGMTALYTVSLIFGLSQGGLVPAYAIIVREYMNPAEAGARVGFVIMSTVLGMALGGWMSGWIYDLTGSYMLAFLNGVAWNVLNFAVIMLLLIRSRPRKMTDRGENVLVAS